MSLLQTLNKVYWVDRNGEICDMIPSNKSIKYAKRTKVTTHNFVLPNDHVQREKDYQAHLKRLQDEL